MRKLLLSAIAVLLFSSCGVKIYPIQGQYPFDPTSIVKCSADKKDELWSRIMKLFAENDIAIKTIDKSAGFIKSERQNFSRYVEMDSREKIMETREGKYFISEFFIESLGDPIRPPGHVVASIKIFVIDDKDSISLRVSIDELYAGVIYRKLDIKSKGVLEREMSSYFLSGQDMPKLILPKAYTR